MTRFQTESPSPEEESSDGELSNGESAGSTRALLETTRCSNCGNRHVGSYCNECGQRQFGRLTVWHMVRLFAERAFELERGLWPTLRDLTIDPGGLIQRYLRGKRRRYVNPASYFLLAIALLSLVIGAIPTSFASTRSIGGELGAVLGALQAQYQILFFLFTAGIGAGLIRAFFPYRVNVAEATAACMYLMGHSFLALSLIRGSRRVLGDPAPVVISYLVIGAVLAWAGWAGYRAFERHWWPAIRMMIVPVVWFIAILSLLIQAQSRFSISTARPPFDATESREERSTRSILYTVPTGETTSVADFESMEPGQSPRRWTTLYAPPNSDWSFRVDTDSVNQYLYVTAAEPASDENSNQSPSPDRLRERLKFEYGGTLRADSLERPWNPRRSSYLRWKWRVLKTGSGHSMKPARPSSSNAGVNIGDGVVLEVHFQTASLGRPASRSLRYVYSTTRNSDSLFVESNGRANFAIATFIVDSTGDSLGQDSTRVEDEVKSTGNAWRTVRRNVASDYRHAFGERPPDSVDHVQVSIDFDPPYAKGNPDTVRAGVDDLRLYTSPPND